MNEEFGHSEASAMVTRNKQDRAKSSHQKTILTVLTNPPRNALIALKLAIPKAIVMNLLGIQNGGIIIVAHGRRNPRRCLLQQWLKQKQMMISWERPRH